MENNQLIGLISSAIVGVGVLLLNESIKEIIKKFFSGLNRKQVNIIFFLLIAVVVIGTYYAVNITTDQKATKPLTEAAQETQVAKSDLEVYAEMGEVALEQADNIVQNKQKKDSIREAQRAKMWVYQVGLPMDEDELWEAYKALKDIPNVCAFRESKKKYRLLIDNRLSSEQEAKDGLDDLKSKIGTIESRVSIIDLSSFCSKREGIKKGSDLTAKREPTEIPCYICD